MGENPQAWPETVRDVAEWLGHELWHHTPGQFRLELIYRDGRLVQLFRHEEKIPAVALDRPLHSRRTA